jgi:DNA-binding PadR family transcriptional regulator
MTPVFRHGALRLYLLKLLDEHPRHGYEVISLLEDRFLGLYAPSAGTVYPRLSRLETEGLVEHEEVDGRKTYRLTDAGRDELHRNTETLRDLEHDITRSVAALASDVRSEVRASVRDLREELKQAARDVRRETRSAGRRVHQDGLGPVLHELDVMRREVLLAARAATAEARVAATEALQRARDETLALLREPGEDDS